MTAFAQYPYAALQSVGSNLNSISEQVESDSKGAVDVDGLGGDQSDIAGAIGDFRDEWKYSVDKLGENIGNFGDLSKQIGEMAGGLDQALADAMRVGGGAAPGGPGGIPV